MSVRGVGRPEQDGDPELPRERLSINIAKDAAEAVREIAARRKITITEGIRRAIAVWKFIEDEQAKGNKVAVVEERDGKTSVRELVFFW